MRFRRSISTLTWIMLGIIILIIIIFVYVSSYGTSRQDTNKSKQDRLEDLGRIDRLEGVYLQWVILATVFLIMTFRVKGFEAASIYFSVAFMIITIIIFVIANVEYLYERMDLCQDVIKSPARLDYLFAIVGIVIIICVFLLYDILKNDKTFASTIGKD